MFAKPPAVEPVSIPQSPQPAPAPEPETEPEPPAETPTPEPNRGIAEAAIKSTSDTLPNAADAATAGETTLASIPGGAAPEGMKVVETSPAVHRGIEEIVRAWNRAVLQVAPTKVTRDSVQRFATANNLRLLALEPSIEELVAVGLPALVHLKDGQWAALLRVEDGATQLINHAGDSQSVALADLRNQYDGEAYYLWKDPAPSAGLLRASSSGKLVEELQRDLQKLGLIDRDPNGIYDATTIDTVTKIQRTTGLPADGIAGPQTRMVLASWLGVPGTPRLSNAGFTEGLRSRVLASEGIVTRTRETAAREPAAPPAEIIEPVTDPLPAPVDSVGDPARQEEAYTPILPGNAPETPPAVTPSTSSGPPIRPSESRESGR